MTPFQISSLAWLGMTIAWLISFACMARSYFQIRSLRAHLHMLSAAYAEIVCRYEALAHPVPVFNLPLPDDRRFEIPPEYNGEYGAVMFEIVGDSIHVHNKGLTVVFLRERLRDVAVWECEQTERDGGYADTE